MSSLTNLAIDRAELEELIVSLGRVGALASGGLFRPVYGDAWLEAIALIEQWAFARGLPARRDALGNLYVRLEGRSDGPVVLTGSHIDTVRSGGRFDGALGVVGGLLALPH
mgnify:FL=1